KCTMRVFVETPGIYRARLLFTFTLFLVLLALAHGGAELAAYLDGRTASETARGSAHASVHYRELFTLWVTIILVTLALGTYIFMQPGRRNGYWLGFWTVSYLSFVYYFYWWLADQAGLAGAAMMLVNLVPQLFLVAWWTLDVLFAWIVPPNRKGM